MGTRVHAGEALGKLGADALAALLAARDQGEAVARRGAASGLGAIDAPAALDALERALDESEHLVRSAALHSLGQWLARAVGQSGIGGGPGDAGQLGNAGERALALLL